MARPWRIQYEHAVYHITARGNNRQKIFIDDSDRDNFMALVGRCASRFSLRVFAFCMMDNHYHLFLSTPLANLSAAMHWLNCSYTVYFNRRHRRIGHLLQGRFKSVLVAEDEHYMHLSMYVHLNPVRAKIVADPRDYRWSSFQDYMRSKPRLEWLAPAEILRNYGTSKFSARRRYYRDCLALIGKQPPFLKMLRYGCFIGSREQLDALIRKFKPRGKTGDVPEFASAQRNNLDAGNELMKTLKSQGLSLAALKKTRNNARLKIYRHMVEDCGISPTKVAEQFDVSISAVSHGLKRLKTQTQKSIKWTRKP